LDDLSRKDREFNLEAAMKKKALGRIIVTAVLLTLLLAPFSAALANPPDRFYVEGSGSNPELVDCGSFFIGGKFNVWIRGTNFFDNDGNLISTSIHIHFVGKLTNRDTGLTIRDESFVNQTIDVASNTLKETGLIYNLNVPGYGVIALDVGTLVWDLTTGEILFEGGPHQVLHGLDLDLCTYMGG
jgi:hypothetical protein